MSREVQVRFCERPGVRFPRPTLLVVHCVSENQANRLVTAIANRMEEVGLRLHPDKTKVVYCQDGNRRLLTATVGEDDGVTLTAAVREGRRPRPGVPDGALVVGLAV